MVPVTTLMIQTTARSIEDFTDARDELKPFLYYTLCNLIGGSAFTILDQVEDGNGLDAYRKVHRRYAKTKIQEAITMRINVANTNFSSESDFETRFAKEPALGKPVYDDSKVGLVIVGTARRAKYVT